MLVTGSLKRQGKKNDRFGVRYTSIKDSTTTGKKKNRKGRQKKVIDRPTSVSCSRYEKGALSESGTCKAMKYRSLFFSFLTLVDASPHTIYIPPSAGYPIKANDIFIS